MSLNGLDDAKVTEAYQTALAEAGGWFLLKYVSRDEVEIYKQGKGGVAEARAAIGDYEDKSPLYGFLVYRRRKVLLKYIPEGTSRLLQARVAVHFTSFEEKFTPNDTVFPLAADIELTETALSQACSLHSAAGAESTRSSGGSAPRKSRLDEIVEDPKERPSYDARAAATTAQDQLAPVEKPVNIPSIVESAPPYEKDLPPIPTDAESRPATRDSTLPNGTPLASRKAAAILGIPLSSVSSVSIESSTRRPETPLNPGDAASIYATSLNSLTRSDHLAYLGDDARSSTSTARPSLSDINFAGLYPKPKVKLGPRPSLDTSKLKTGPRPTSSLPPGLRPKQRKDLTLDLHSSQRPTSRSSQLSVGIMLPPPPPIPESPDILTFPRPSSSPASVKSMPATLASKSDKMSKEKKRLMKAMELRKKQMQSKSQPTTPTTATVPVTEVPPVPTINEETVEADKEPKGGADLADALNEAVSEQNKEDAPEEPLQEVEKERPPKIEEPQPEDSPVEPMASPKAALSEKDLVKNPTRASGDHLKADSGVEMDVDKTTREPEDEQRVHGPSSSPVSMEQSSELPSTRPSSISEAGEEGAATDVLAKEIVEQEQMQDKQAHESQETIPAPSDDASKESEPESTPSQMPEVDASEIKEPAEELQDSTKADAGSGEEADNASDTTPTEKSIVHGNDGQLSVALPERKTSVRDKHRAIVRPISVDTQAHGFTDESEVDVSDDEFMVELRNAEVQEAKHVQVSKSPLATVFPVMKPATISAITSTSRSVSSPNTSDRRPSAPPRNASDPSSDDAPRSLSVSRVNQPSDRPGTLSVAKKANISSGISQRIKALARNSGSNEHLPLDRAPSRDSSGPSIVALRKSSFRDITPPSPRPQSSSTLNPTTRERRVSSVSKNLPLPALPIEQSPTLANESPRSQDSIQAVYNVQQRNDKRQSISVTARIVRDPRTENPDLSMPTQTTPLELHESPLIIEHKRGASVPKLHIPAEDKSPARTPESRSPAPSPSPSRDRGALSPAFSLPRSSSENWRNTFSQRTRRASETRSPTAMVRSMSSTSLDTTVSKDSNSSNDKTHERKGSRGSRMLKRMSNSISLGRKTLAEIVSPKISEEAIDPPFPSPVPEEMRSRPHYGLEIGDLNVQLPDTLLWKRRWVEIDSDGYIIVKTSKSNETASTKNATKQYHLSEFKRPFVPDQERQEMPWSVVLDFVDGRTLQCACETGGGQLEVLRREFAILNDMDRY
ncbi:hypothetical protein NA57DRAFT_70097 [Rhizodiscina lignyota]|uniref:ADF-H domain-containing protein n=1 Tax=Rhizodiscina lignyota TaxID=1504668 RepID=A0A9P4MDX0_9PEZI|nr:hypothetical protein NA57DRAFT_70097 [Rhizodiscina lignyota]